MNKHTVIRQGFHMRLTYLRLLILAQLVNGKGKKSELGGCHLDAVFGDKIGDYLLLPDPG